jgi:hypothetical protein
MQTTIDTPSTTTEVRFDHFCFEAEDQQSIILNYVALPALLKTTRCNQIVDKIVAFVALHLQVRERTTFSFHLFCNGMRVRDMAQHRTFMIRFAQMFKMTYPTELEACYVHGAPVVFSSVYDLFRSILPTESRNKIVIVKTSDENQSSELV